MQIFITFCTVASWYYIVRTNFKLLLVSNIKHQEFYLKQQTLCLAILN